MLRVALISLLLAGAALLAQAERYPAELRLRAVGQLRLGLASEEFWPSMHAAEGLTRAGFGSSVAYDLRPRLADEKDHQRRCGLAREIVRGGDSTAVAVLAGILRDPASNGRIHAAESLFKVGQTGDRNILRQGVAGEEPILAIMAAAALVGAGEKEPLARLRAILAHADARARRTAAWALGQVGDTADLPALRALAAKETEPLSVAFVWNALARLGDPEAVGKVVAALASEDQAVRTYAAETLGVCGDTTHLPLLAKALQDANLDTRIRAAEAVVRITNRLLERDSDGDGIPDSIEAELGTPATDAEVLVRFHAAVAKGPGDADPEALPPELTGAWFAHAGGDRYVWIYEFGAAVSDWRTIFHSYCRLDGDDRTGRQGGAAQGVDVMYSFVDGRSDPRVFTPELRVRPDWPIRGIVAANRIYLCDDIRVQQADGKAHATIHLLAERYPNGRTKSKVGRGTSRTDVAVSLRTDRPLPRLAFPETEGFAAVPPDYAARYALRYDKGNVPLAIAEGTGDGFERHYDGYLQSVAGQPGRITVEIPVAGRFRVGFLAQAVGSGMAGLTVAHNDEPMGSVAAIASQAPGTLFVSAERRFRKGDTLTFAATERGSAGRFGDVALLKTVPTVPPFAIRHLASAVLPPLPGQDEDRVTVVWTTNRDATCRIRLTAGEREETFAVPDQPGMNHRFLVPAAFRTADCRATVEAVSGQDSASASLPVGTARPNPGPKAGRPGQIVLTVAETAPEGRLGWPVTSGVPFPQGVLADGARCRVLGPDGRPVPAQFRELARWPDGSVKWLLVDTVANTRPGEETHLGLQYNVDPARFGGVEVAETADAIVLSSGTFRLHLDRRRFEPLGGAAAGALEITDPEGNVFASANLPPEEMAVEERGPVRATVRVRGQFANTEGKTWMRYLCRVHLHANQPWVRLEITLENDALEPQMSRIARFELPLAVPEGAVPRFGTPPARRLLQDYDSRFLLDGKPQPGHAPGYCAMGPLTVAVRDFWQLYPKGFQADGESLRVQFLPPLPTDQYQSEEDRKLEDRLYFWCDQGAYKIRTGTRFTTEIAVALDSRSEPAQFHSWIERPLFAACSAEIYCASAAWGGMAPRQENAFTRYEANLAKAFDEFLARRDTVREYGFFNFGDWYGERTWNWGNVEYDTQFALGVHFLRTGDRRMLDRAEEADAHNADIDTTHHDPNPANVGRPFTHCIGHTGGYYPNDFRDMGGFNSGPRDVGHTWCRGHFLLWNLTGNERFRETGEKVAHHLAASTPRNRHLGQHRDGGWTLIGAIGAYQGTGDPHYLNGARLVVERILDKQRPNGQWGHPIWECRDEYPRPWGCKPFMTGVILHALAIFDRIEATPRVQDAIRRGADYLWEKTYVHDQHGFIYAEAPRFQGKGGIWTMTLTGDGLAYACRLDPERRHRDLLLDALSHNMYRAGVNSFGKGFTQGLCFTVYMLDELHELGIANPPPVVTPPDARLRSHVLLAPGQSMTFRPQVKLDADTPQACTLAYGGKADAYLGGKATFSWEAKPGISLGPEIHVQAPATPGTVVLPVTITVGDRSENRELRIEAVAPASSSGKAVGWITDGKDPLAAAAKALGRTVAPIADLGKANLDAYGVIVLGAEAHEKNFANCRAAAQRLSRWVVQGGTLLVGQLNDGAWQPDFLPFDLALSNDSTAAAAVAMPDHPLFRNVATADLVGTISYDQVLWAAPEWQVLLRAANGSPAILAADCGAGRVLFVMPSFDREVPKGTAPACNALIGNFLSSGQ